MIPESMIFTPSNMSKPYLPSVSLDQIKLYCPTDEATWTCSHLVNAVLEAICESNAISCNEIADFMHLDARKLSAAIEIETGMKLQELLHQFKLAQIQNYIESHPKATQEEIAKANGYASDCTLWRFFQRKLGTTPSGAVSRSKSDERWQAQLREMRNKLER